MSIVYGTADQTLELTVHVPLSAVHPGGSVDWVIAEPWPKLVDKYFAGGSVLSVEFDRYGARRGTDSAWRNRLEGADLTATVLMNSRVESADVDRVMTGNLQAIHDGLEAIPYSADLTAEGWGRHAAALAKVLAALKVRRVSVAKIGKVLCLKRPGLVPMLDGLVRAALYGYESPDGVPGVPDDPAAFADTFLAEMRAFRKVLTYPHPTHGTNLAVLTRLTGALNGEMARRLGEPFDWLTPVRVLDNLLWFEWGGREHFGWTEDPIARRVYKPSTVA